MKIWLSLSFFSVLLCSINVYADKTSEALVVMDETMKSIVVASGSINDIVRKVSDLNEKQGSKGYVIPSDMKEELIKRAENFLITWDNALIRVRDTNLKLTKNNKKCQEAVESHRQQYFEDYSRFVKELPAIRSASDDQVATAVTMDLYGYLAGISQFGVLIDKCLLVVNSHFSD